MHGQPLPPLHQLETFLAVLDTGGFDAGARSLGISAPAVSQRVRALEAALGRSLLQRTTPVEPTAAGERLLPYARRLVALAADAANSARGSTAEDGPPALSLAVNADSLSTWFMEALAAYPRVGEVTFRIERADENLTARALAAGQVAGAVTTQAEAAAACVAHPLGALRYLPVAAPAFLRRHGLRPGTPGTGERLLGVPRVDFDLDDPLQHDFLRGWTGRDPGGPVHLVPGSEAFVRAIGLGLGWGLVPEPQADTALAAGSLVLLSSRRHVDVQLHWQEWDLAPAPVHAFGKWLRGFAEARLRRA